VGGSRSGKINSAGRNSGSSAIIAFRGRNNCNARYTRRRVEEARSRRASGMQTNAVFGLREHYRSGSFIASDMYDLSRGDISQFRYSARKTSFPATRLRTNLHLSSPDTCSSTFESNSLQITFSGSNFIKIPNSTRRKLHAR